jgi:hypothetical protein
MKIKLTFVLLSSVWLAACGGGAGDVNSAAVADPATQAAMSAIAQRARSEVQEPNAGDVAVAGIERNAQVLARTVLNKP